MLMLDLLCCGDCSLLNRCFMNLQVGFSTLFQHASWRLWKSCVKLFRIRAFQATAIVEHHVSTSVPASTPNLPKRHRKWATLTFPCFWAGCCTQGNATSSPASDQFIFGKLTLVRLLWEQSEVHLAGLGRAGYKAPYFTTWKALDIKTRTSSIRWLNQHLKG